MLLLSLPRYSPLQRQIIIKDGPFQTQACMLLDGVRGALERKRAHDRRNQPRLVAEVNSLIKSVGVPTSTYVGPAQVSAQSPFAFVLHAAPSKEGGRWPEVEEMAQKIGADLTAIGLRCTREDASDSPATLAALKLCTICVVIITPATAGDLQLRDRLGFAENCCRTIVPVLGGDQAWDVAISPGIEYQLGQLPHVFWAHGGWAVREARQDLHGGNGGLATVVQGMLQASGSPEAVQDREAELTQLRCRVAALEKELATALAAVQGDVRGKEAATAAAPKESSPAAATASGKPSASLTHLPKPSPGT